MSNYEFFTAILNNELKPALGCTDPISIAFAAALAAKHAKGVILSIEGTYSKQLIRNVAAVNIPGAPGCVGVVFASAIGAVAGKPDLKLEALRGITEQDVLAAQALIADGKVAVSISEAEKALSLSVTVKSTAGEATVVIEDDYVNVTEIHVNGKRLEIDNGGAQDEKTNLGRNALSLSAIVDFAQGVPLSALDCIKAAMEMNKNIVDGALNNAFDLRIGEKLAASRLFGGATDTLEGIVPLWTCAAIEARMCGCPLPAMSNVGSGNQGIMSTIPVMAANEVLKMDEETLMRAVALSCLVTIYIKGRFGKLTTICGALISCIGSGCGMVFLSGGGQEEMLHLIKNMVGNLPGIICDGAKATCALKSASCIQAACMSYRLAMAGYYPEATNGLVGAGETDTLDNFVKFSTEGLSKADDVILDIIMSK